MGIPVVDIHGDRQAGKSHVLEAVATQSLDSTTPATGLYVSENMAQAESRFHNIRVYLSGCDEYTFRWNSREHSITSGMSRLLFTSYRSVAAGMGRGLTLNTLFLDDYMDYCDTAIASLIPCMSSARLPRIYRAHWSDKTDWLD